MGGASGHSGALCGVAPYGRGLISVFQELFASIDEIFNLTGRLGARLLFYGV